MLCLHFVLKDKESGPKCCKFDLNFFHGKSILKVCMLEDLFFLQTCHFGKNLKAKNLTGASSHRKFYAFMACSLNFEETECKTIFAACKMKHGEYFRSIL